MQPSLKTTEEYYSPLMFTGLCGVSAFYNIIAQFFILMTGRGLIEKQLSPQSYRPALPSSLSPNDVISVNNNNINEINTARVAIITGSNTGIGFEAAKGLVIDYGYTVILACRSRDKGQKAADIINEEAAAHNSKGKALFLIPLDLSSLQSVRLFCKEIKLQYKHNIHTLINNAGISSGGISEDNFDLTFQANFLGHFVLTCELIDDIQASKGGRIINLSSVMHHFCKGNHNLNDVEFWKSTATSKAYPGLQTYALTKLAAIIFTMELNRRYGKLIKSIAVDPGAVNSDIWRDFPRYMRTLFSWIYLNTKQGARTTLAAAVLDDKDLPIGVRDNNYCCYLQPYWIPKIPDGDVNSTPFPLYEMMGPFQGYRITRPRLPREQGSISSGEALWVACTALTGCTWPVTS